MDDPLPYDSPMVSEHHVVFETCYAILKGSELILGNELIERRWQVSRGLLYASRLFDKTAACEWIASPAPQPAPTPDVPISGGPVEFTFTASTGPMTPTEAPSLVVSLGAVFTAEDSPTGTELLLTYRFQIFPESPAVTQNILVGYTQQPPLEMTSFLHLGGNGRTFESLAANDMHHTSFHSSPTGVETLAQSAEELPPLDLQEMLRLPAAHLRFLQVTLHDQTDVHNELVTEREWLLHPAEDTLDLTGNLFVLENTLTGAGLIFIKHAPLPHARPFKTPTDLLLKMRSGGLLALYGHGLGAKDGPGYAWGTLAYTGGNAGRTQALHAYQRCFRQFDPERDARFLSNTWGDRSRDSRINEGFMRQEIEAGARLGVDVIQIDDGWESGRTANSATPGGVWIGFWASNPNFWQPDPQRFPNGLKPLIEAARQKGMGFGLWFAPDSSDSFANWQRDADTLLSLHRELGVNYFKIDGVKATTKAGERNLARFFARVLQGSAGKVSFDLDVTAETRPGYFGAMTVGPLFVENRYTDWRRYWPHFTLRNLWKLAHYVDPARLRIEFLNNTRNQRLYQDDPLAPAAYSPAYLFATTMFANPLGWFEISSLPEAYFAEIAPLAKVWKQHRAALFAGNILPVGAAPDGTAWTGFAALHPWGGYLLLFRELNDQAEWEYTLPVTPTEMKVEVLGGEGKVRIEGGRLKAMLPNPRSFVFVKFEA